MEEYAAAKRLLFVPETARSAVGRAECRRSGAKAMQPPARRATHLVRTFGEGADLRAENIASGFRWAALRRDLEGPASASRIAAGGTHQRLEYSGGGRALGLSYGLDLDDDRAMASRTAARCPGASNESTEGQPFLVVVDYAHTDDALRNVIQTARESDAKGRVITLFGCGGDRDRTKRPLMGMAAAELSDFVVLTSDNPRSEDPLDIMNDAMVGLRRFDTPHVAEPDRAKAIRLAHRAKRSPAMWCCWPARATKPIRF